MTDLEITIKTLREVREQLAYYQMLCDSATHAWGFRSWRRPHPLDRDKLERRQMWKRRLRNVMGRLAFDLRDSDVDGCA